MIIICVSSINFTKQIRLHTIYHTQLKLHQDRDVFCLFEFTWISQSLPDNLHNTGSFLIWIEPNRLWQLHNNCYIGGADTRRLIDQLTDNHAVVRINVIGLHAVAFTRKLWRCSFKEQSYQQRDCIWTYLTCLGHIRNMYDVRNIWLHSIIIFSRQIGFALCVLCDLTLS